RIVYFYAVRRSQFPVLISFIKLIVVVLCTVIIGTLNGPSCRSIVSRNSQSNCRTISQTHLSLDQSFSKGPPTYNDPTIVILNSPSDDFTSRCRLLID